MTAKTGAVYDKANSFLAVSGVGTGIAEVLERVRTLRHTLATDVQDQYRRQILEQACTELLEESPDGQPGFRLRPHIVEEMRRLSDEEMHRYLFYRYRYDVFPSSRQLDAFPPCVQIEPTSICNYRCVFCYQTDTQFSAQKHGHMGQMPLELFKTVVDQLEGQVEAVTLASRGEPLVCREIEAMLDYIRGKFLGLKINTNAWLLDEAKAHALLAAEPNTIVISADAAEPELYAKLRVNGKLDRVLANVRRLAEIRAKHYPDSRTILRVSGVRYSETLQDFNEIEKFWREFVDQVAFVAYNPWESVYDAAPSHISAPCSDLWRRLFVWWDGRVNPCDVDYRSTLAVGNISQGDQLSELWRGERYQQLRENHLSGCRQKLTPCQGCALI